MGYSFAIGRPLDELPPTTVCAQVELVARHGFDRIEWSCRDASLLSAPSVGRSLDAAGVRVSALGTGAAALGDGLALTASEPGRRGEARRRVEAAIQLAAELGAATIVGLLRGPGAEGADPEPRERLVAALSDLAAQARRHGTQLVLEPINRYEVDNLATIASVVELIAEVGDPGLAPMADLFHMNIEEGDLAGVLGARAAELAYVHVADSDRRAPGSGHLPIRELLEALRAGGYRGPLVCELIPSGDLEADVGAAAAGLRGVLGTA